MKHFKLLSFLIFMAVITSNKFYASTVKEVDLLIIGGGASGITAGIQAARLGTKTLIIEETEWLGGMLTSAGVSAIDGNHNLPSGLWGEYREKLYDYYGGPEKVETGWVSNTLFEPSVGNEILKELADNKNLKIWYRTKWLHVQRKGGNWSVIMDKNGKKKKVRAKLLIDATELGDVMAAVGVSYNIGMNSRHATHEEIAPLQENDIIQDMTYVAILKDFGKGSDKTIPKPDGYDPKEFRCACDVSDATQNEPSNIDCKRMIEYGRLPNNKYMINWPKCGNDIYLNIIEKSPAERREALKEAKLHTLRFIYYLQTELGFENLGIAKDEFPTTDGLPMIPYHRESRLMNGMVKLTLNYLAKPYDQKHAFYRTGVVVGDYPIDHHHAKNPAAPEINFKKATVPSYNIPIGALIPKKVNGLIVAEKSISVTNIVNGTTRLQPVVMGIGQAAGVLAALSIQKNTEPREVKIRSVQQRLLKAKAYLMPYMDIKPYNKHFEAIQRIGATGILKGIGVPYRWANQTWFYPNRLISENELIFGLETYYKKIGGFPATGKELTLNFLTNALHTINSDIAYKKIVNDWSSLNVAQSSPDRNLELNRGTVAVILDKYLNPFHKDIDFNGHLISEK